MKWTVPVLKNMNKEKLKKSRIRRGLYIKYEKSDYPDQFRYNPMIFKIIENTNIHVTNIMQFQTISKTLE
jgi:hypothetical protein